MRVAIVKLDEIGGEADIKIVSEEVFNWINSKDLGRSPKEEERDAISWVDRTAPKEVIEYLMEDDEQPEITRSTYSNDRAILAPPQKSYKNEWPETIREARKIIKERGDTAVGKYSGMMY